MSEMPTALKPYIAKITQGQVLSFEEAHDAFALIMSGQATPAQLAAFLVALKLRGEHVDEITAAASVIRDRMIAVSAPPGAIDIVGTGGDGAHTLNISTATAIVTAACGVPVAKHGNRAVSSRSGMTDVLGALGLNLEASVPALEYSLREAGLCFMQAPRHHLSFRHVGPVRQELGIRTIFNILGPLCNPAAVKRYLIGVYIPEWVEPIGQTLARLGCEKAWVVHGAGGLDELSTLGPNRVAMVEGARVSLTEINPEDAGLPRATLEELRGGDSGYNAERLRLLLDGQRDAYRDIVLFGAAAALVIADKTADLRQGVAQAAEAIDSGHAKATLDASIRLSNTGVD
ncbi:MAG: anthranilate phosphoribosyltransferase [Pseudomonadales bacterium]|jgi:anthranilate phosphoribosyltransferase|nr:anthranilate phosphoribosyltransferase [Pseudomonadales bacterium]